MTAFVVTAKRPDGTEFRCDLTGGSPRIGELLRLPNMPRLLVRDVVWHYNLDAAGRGTLAAVEMPCQFIGEPDKEKS